jgi:hypothetical protein
VLRDPAAFRHQALQFSFCLSAHTVGESIGALPMFVAEWGQAHLQVGLVLFQAAQQTLGFGDFFFECDRHHRHYARQPDVASRASTVP